MSSTQQQTQSPPSTIPASPTTKQFQNLYNSTLSHPYFDRQIRIPQWDQERESQQIVLCLGCGGLGCSVALGCLRMGVKKIILVDYDTVETHNLNRQLLFSRAHVGRSKVACAKEVLEELHNLDGTVVEAHHFDAKKEWHRVVELSQECTVIFNLIDQGDEWDIAVQSLALVRAVPFLSGGTFQTTVTADFCRPRGGPCNLCMGSSRHMDVVRERLTPQTICEQRDLNFLEREKMPIGASNVYVASTCSNLMLAAWSQWLMTPNDTSIPNRTFLYMNNFDVEKWCMKGERDCVVCGTLQEEDHRREEQERGLGHVGDSEGDSKADPQAADGDKTKDDNEIPQESPTNLQHQESTQS